MSRRVASTSSCCSTSRRACRRRSGSRRNSARRRRAVREARTRLDATKDAIKTFVRSRRDDRIGLIVFSDNPYVVSPLTFDHDYLLRYIDFVDDQILQGEGQTAIGDGLALSNYLLARQTASGSKAHQAIVLFTDGEYNRGRDPVEVLAESKAADIRVHVVGVDLDMDVKLKPAVQDLITTVERNGGRYFDAGSERELVAASRAIDSIEKSTLVSRVYVHDVPVYEWFVVPALVLFTCAHGHARRSVFRRSDLTDSGGRGSDSRHSHMSGSERVWDHLPSQPVCGNPGVTFSAFW